MEYIPGIGKFPPAGKPIAPKPAPGRTLRRQHRMPLKLLAPIEQIPVSRQFATDERIPQRLRHIQRFQTLESPQIPPSKQIHMPKLVMIRRR